MVGYRQTGLTPALHRGLPSPHLTLILTLDEPLELVAHPDPGQPPGSCAALVGGLHTRPALIATGTRQAGVQVSLTPAGARALLGVPAGALRSRDEPLADVLGGPAAELLDRVRGAGSWPARFAAVDDVLGRLALRDAPGAAPEVTHAWQLTTGSAGRLPVATVAATVGWSERHLRQRFTAEFGLSPKEAARVVRFDVARRRLGSAVARGSDVDLAGLAAGAGYADQAHLTREWRELAGLPPRRWLAAEHQLLRADADDPLRFVQDGPAPVSTS
nr:helix-turn-helix domain-containing protein [Modestobacter marinus]